MANTYAGDDLGRTFIRRLDLSSREERDMYGTVARYRAKPGNVDALLELQRQLDADPPPGFVAAYIYQMDDDPEEFLEAVLFENRETYMANADSPEQHQWYLKMRALVEADPEWHDGTVIHPSG